MATIEINTAGSNVMAFGDISAERASQITGLPFYEIEDGVKASAKNRKAARIAAGELEVACREAETAPATAAAPSATTRAYQSRRVELVEVAERDGLNRGKGWICRENDIQTKGAHPSWEGAAICYVYE